MMNNKVIFRVFRYFRDEGKFGINIFSPADNIKLYDSWIPRVCNKSNMTGATYGAGNIYHSGVHCGF
jgi:hypothetical protein